MLPPIEELKKRRIKLGLSQRKFASYLGVSQSTITKIENKKLSPSYELVKKAYDILDSFGSPQIGLAGDIAIKKVVAVQDNDLISKAVQILQQHGFKQLLRIENAAQRQVGVRLQVLRQAGAELSVGTGRDFDVETHARQQTGAVGGR